MVCVREKCERQPILGLERRLRFDRIGTDADDSSAEFFETGEIITDSACFFRSARGICLGVEVQDCGPSLEIARREGGSLVGRRDKVWDAIARVQWHNACDDTWWMPHSGLAIGSGVCRRKWKTCRSPC
jgi:hypothetical protein